MVTCLFCDVHNFSFISFFFYTKLTADLSSITGPYQNVSSVSNVTKTSNFEMKDNQVVTTPTISTPPLYEIVT